MRAVLTGHLVLSTMHTQDVLGVPARLIDLGVSPMMLSGALQAVIAQRLVRRVCAACGGVWAPPGPKAGQASVSRQECAQCRDGFKGRMCLAEHMIMDADMHDVVSQGGDRAILARLRHERKIPTLWDHGLDLVKANLTTEEELIRVLGPKPPETSNLSNRHLDPIAKF
jgi:type II secretory ATPase GspE/PulE/Tfp pilus assembly ATPase PilB-like protein